MIKDATPAYKIGHVLRGLRQRKGLSQLEVSLRCGVSARHYQAIEYGTKNCQVTTLTKILEVYDIDLFHFFSSFFVDEFQKNGVQSLYEIFGHNAFGYRCFDLEGTVTSQCPYSAVITGMSDDEVIGKMKIWSDLTDGALVNFIKISLKYFVTYLPPPPSWKVHIKNHKLNTSKLHVGFLRYTKSTEGKVIGVEIIIFPVQEA